MRVAAVGMLLPGLLWQVAGNAPLPDTSLCSFQMIVETGMEHDNAHHKRLPHSGVEGHPASARLLAPHVVQVKNDPMGRRQVDRSKVKQITHTDIINVAIYPCKFNIQHAALTHFETNTDAQG